MSTKAVTTEKKSPRTSKKVKVVEVVETIPEPEEVVFYPDLDVVEDVLQEAAVEASEPQEAPPESEPQEPVAESEPQDSAAEPEPLESPDKPAPKPFVTRICVKGNHRWSDEDMTDEDLQPIDPRLSKEARRTYELERRKKDCQDCKTAGKPKGPKAPSAPKTPVEALRGMVAQLQEAAKKAPKAPRVTGAPSVRTALTNEAGLTIRPFQLHETGKETYYPMIFLKFPDGTSYNKHSGPPQASKEAAIAYATICAKEILEGTREVPPKGQPGGVKSTTPKVAKVREVRLRDMVSAAYQAEAMNW